MLRKTEHLGAEGTDAFVRLLDEMDQRSTARFDQTQAELRTALDQFSARLDRAVADIAEVSADRTRVWREWTQTVTLGLTGLGVVVAVAIAIAKLLH